jgi:enamine deaminase RidA (YjgF/YER057c/UK114 family)
VRPKSLLFPQHQNYSHVCRGADALSQSPADAHGDHQPTSTIVCAQLLDPRWKLEMEAMAAQ